MSKLLYPSLPVLMVDDEESWLRGMGIALKRLGGISNLLTCTDGRQVTDLLARQKVSVILLDYTLPHVSGEELLQRIVREHPDVPVIVITGRDQVEIAVSCMKLGAYDYFVKTTEEERLVAGVQRAIRFVELQQENRQLQAGFLEEGLKHPEAFSGIVTRSVRMGKVLKYLEAIADSSQPVLITGESGVGKELIARTLHRLGNPEGPWVPVNVSGLDEELFADTLFGHLKGAFPGADQPRSGLVQKAAGGTLFLDEIGALSQTTQIKLLRLLQDGEYYPVGSDRPKKAQARIIVATNHNLTARLEAGEFRRDLYYRLRTHHIHLPPLRQRPEDIPPLLDHFLADAAREFGKKKPTPPPELETLLATWHFPGNVRELRAMVYDAVSVHQARKLSMDSFKRAMGREVDDDLEGGDVGGQAGPAILSFPEKLPTLREAVSQLIAEAGRRADGNQTIMAGMLGISRPALNKRLKKLEGLD